MLMLKLKIFQVDAFAGHVFEGNPAAVCPLESWLDDALLQAIAEENNLAETAFLVPLGDAYELRWFTPVAEVDLCGHATLASAHVLYRHLAYDRPTVRFLTRSGELRVTQTSAGLSMDFPASPPQRTTAPEALLAGLGQRPCEVLSAFDYVAVYESEAQVRALQPDFAQLLTLDLRGVIATAPGDSVDFVSRCFFPKLRVSEDPVTGSAHCELAPYWSARLGQATLDARQLSKRGGAIGCMVEGDRVLLTGKAIDFMSGEISIALPT